MHYKKPHQMKTEESCYQVKELSFNYTELNNKLNKYYTGSSTKRRDKLSRNKKIHWEEHEGNFWQRAHKSGRNRLPCSFCLDDGCRYMTFIYLS